MGKSLVQQPFGAATLSIPVGEHVHVHNIEGIRGRGDKRVGEEQEHANV